jgi:hypothetical protein
VRKVRACCRCGCTDDDCSQCIERTGTPCHWVSEDLCSACDFKIEAGGEYACRDGKTRRVVAVEGGNVLYSAHGVRRYSMQIRRFQVNALRRLSTPAAKSKGAS